MGVGSFLVQAWRSTAALDQCESRNTLKQARIPRCVSTPALHRSRQWILRVAETSGGAKQPFYITRRDGLPIAFAGLWENAKELLGTAAIVTTAASEETRQIHDRMPVIIEKPDFPRWLASQSLTKREAEKLFRPSPVGSLLTRPVSSRVNNVRNDDASLIDEIQSIQPQSFLIAGI